MVNLKIAVLGGGSWGTTVASLAARNAPVILWARDADVVQEINSKHTNEKYLPGITLPNKIVATTDLAEAVSGADWVVTDTWASMGQEQEKQARIDAFKGYQVNEALMSHAHDDAVFMHCLPAYRGMEVNETILDSHYSVVWDEAENRLHAQKALMEFLLVKPN